MGKVERVEFFWLPTFGKLAWGAWFQGQLKRQLGEEVEVGQRDLVGGISDVLFYTAYAGPRWRAVQVGVRLERGPEFDYDAPTMESLSVELREQMREVDGMEQMTNEELDY